MACATSRHAACNGCARRRLPVQLSDIAAPAYTATNDNAGRRPRLPKEVPVKESSLTTLVFSVLALVGAISLLIAGPPRSELAAIACADHPGATSCR